MDEIIGFPDADNIDKSNNCDCLFINGAESNYVQQKHHSKIYQYFPSAKLQSISNAGHWLHAEQPKAVLNTLKLFLNNEEK